MDGNLPISSETQQPNVALELAQANHKLQIAEGKIMKLELELLQSRDFAIGAAAAVGEATANLERANAKLSEVVRANDEHRARSKQLDLVYQSNSWKIGRFFTFPIRILKRLAR